MQSTKRLLFLATLLTTGGACGNYSNEDVDYQLALPEQEVLAVKLPLVADAPDQARFYRDTREVVRTFNGLLEALTFFIDHVRAHPPTQRTPNGRIWGPFPHERDRRWQVQLRIEREAERFVYRIEFRPRLGDFTWRPLMTGWYRPAGGVQKGEGELALELTEARRGGYPVDDFKTLRRLSVRYQTAALPVRVEMELLHVAESPEPRITYSYEENADGSGAMAFVARQSDIQVQTMEVRSRWLGSGAGIADVVVTEGFLAPAAIKECWAPDGRATYSKRSWEMVMVGEESACPVFGP